MSARARLEGVCGSTPPPELIRDLDAHAAEVLHETPLFLAEFDSADSEVHLTLASARAMCDDIAKAVANGSCWDWSRNEDGVYVQFWTHEDDDRPLHLTGGTVTEVRVQHPDEGGAGAPEKATPTGEATPTTGWTHVDGFPVQCPHCHTTQSHCNTCGTDMYDQPTEGAS